MQSVEKKIYLGLLVCFLVASVGVSFAYFAQSTTFTGTGGNVDARTSDFVHVSYNRGTALDFSDAKPSDSRSKTFTVSIEPTATDKGATYLIYFDITTNSFVKCSSSNKVTTYPNRNDCTINAQELKYSLTENGTEIATGDLLEKTGKIEIAKVTKANLTENKTYNYELTITFINTGADQNHNANKTLTGTINVEFANPD